MVGGIQCLSLFYDIHFFPSITLFFIIHYDWFQTTLYTRVPPFLVWKTRQLNPWYRHCFLIYYHLPVADGGFPEASGGVRNGDWDVSGAFHRRVIPPWSVRHTETSVLACICTGSQPLQDGHGKGQGGGSMPSIRGSSHTTLA